jgi:Fe-S-cluster containining protein
VTRARAARATYDCTACGACCCNSDENRAEGFRDYVEVRPDEALAGRPELLRRVAVAGADGAIHLRLDPTHRCVALRGPLGRRVACVIYPHRPTACRRVQPGDADCVRARRERGIDRVEP